MDVDEIVNIAHVFSCKNWNSGAKIFILIGWFCFIINDYFQLILIPNFPVFVLNFLLISTFRWYFFPFFIWFYLDNEKPGVKSNNWMEALNWKETFYSSAAFNPLLIFLFSKGKTLFSNQGIAKKLLIKSVSFR